MKLPNKTLVGALGVCALAITACHKPSASGQVLATVGGKDVTLQDVRAEGRANNVPPTAGHAADVALLQRVVERTLLAQSAHAQGMDRTPEAPSDLARLQQSWLAEKSAKKLLSGLTPPTDAEAQASIAAHPYAFAKRERVSAKTVNIAASPALLTQLKTYSTFDQVQAFLRRLGVSMKVAEGQLDTAQLPTQAAAQAAATPVGTLLITQPPGQIQVAQIVAHTPIMLSPQDQLNLAKRSLAAEKAGKTLNAALGDLKTRFPVTYQSGYAPPANKPAPPHAG